MLTGKPRPLENTAQAIRRNYERCARRLSSCTPALVAAKRIRSVLACRILHSGHRAPCCFRATFLSSAGTALVDSGMGKRMDLVHRRRIALTAHGTNPITICIFCRRLVAHYPSTLDHQRKSRKSGPEPRIAKTSQQEKPTKRTPPTTPRVRAGPVLPPSLSPAPATHPSPRRDREIGGCFGVFFLFDVFA